jgi:large subunit ribosomal protein L31
MWTGRTAQIRGYFQAPAASIDTAGVCTLRHVILAKESKEKEIPAMKAGIHPAYNEVKVTCACGHSFPTRSTHKGDLRVEICASCHPFFTGKQKLIDTEGRVDRFQKKYANLMPKTKKEKADEKAAV